MVLQLEQYEMPDRTPTSGLRGDDLRVISVYNQIDSEDFYDLNDPEDQDLILTEFAGRDTYIARDTSSGSIKGVALYAPLTEPRVSEIIGLAVDAPYRGSGVGTFLVARMTEVSQNTRRKAIDVIAVESAREFWERKGFEVIKPRLNDPSFTSMRFIL